MIRCTSIYSTINGHRQVEKKANNLKVAGKSISRKNQIQRRRHVFELEKRHVAFNVYTLRHKKGGRFRKGSDVDDRRDICPKLDH